MLPLPMLPLPTMLPLPMLPLLSMLPLLTVLLPMLPLTLLRCLPTATTMLLLMTTLELPSTRQRPMMALVLWRDLTLSTFLMAVHRLSTTTPMIMMVLSLRSATRELLPILKPLPMDQLLLMPHLFSLMPLPTLLLILSPILLPMLLPILLPMLLPILLDMVLPTLSDVRCPHFWDKKC